MDNEMDRQAAHTLTHNRLDRNKDKESSLRYQQDFFLIKKSKSLLKQIQG